MEFSGFSCRVKAKAADNKHAGVYGGRMRDKEETTRKQGAGVAQSPRSSSLPSQWNTFDSLTQCHLSAVVCPWSIHRQRSAPPRILKKNKPSFFTVHGTSRGLSCANALLWVACRSLPNHHGGAGDERCAVFPRDTTRRANRPALHPALCKISDCLYV